MILVSYHDIEIAVNRFRGYNAREGMLKQIGIQASHYDASLDAWYVSEADANRIRMLCGPYYHAVLKIMEIKNESN